jgi:hypothetical protein
MITRLAMAEAGIPWPKALYDLSVTNKGESAMTNKISKTTFTFVVLHRTDEPFVGTPDHSGPYADSLGEALERSWDGHAVGWTVDAVTEEVPDQDVSEELGKLGNDGTFFDFDLEEAD